MQKLEVSDIEVNEFQRQPGQSMMENIPTLLNLMFHIGHKTFDQLLTGALKLDYSSWFHTPMSLTTERAWLQVLQRYEFQEKTRLSVHETVMVAYITSQLKP